MLTMTEEYCCHELYFTSEGETGSALIAETGDVGAKASGFLCRRLRAICSRTRIEQWGNELAVDDGHTVKAPSNTSIVFAAGHALHVLLRANSHVLVTISLTTSNMASTWDVLAQGSLGLGWGALLSKRFRAHSVRLHSMCTKSSRRHYQA